MVGINARIATVAIYTHPELYPPVLNVIDELNEVFDSIHVISRNLKINHWKYPDHVQFTNSGKYLPVHVSERASTWWKINSFFRFTRHFYKTMKRERSQWVMCNDPISLLSFRLIRPYLGYSVQLWYQSHDVIELKSVRKFSVGYFSVKSEQKYFHKIDLFTLPSESRLKFFPINRLKGKWLIVPNYPSLQRSCIGKTDDWKSGTDLKLLYQGRVSDEHGLEEIIDFIKTDASLRLTIIGPGDETFIHTIRTRINKWGISDRAVVLDPVPYSDLLGITLSHQVGLAVNKPVNLLYSTAAMASNKIYEYAASGLPILYYKNEHYTKYLGQYSWAFPTDLSFSDLSSIFLEIRTNYHSLSRAAEMDFKNKLNFKVAFYPVLSFISKLSQFND